MIAATLPLAAIALLGALLRHFNPAMEQTRQAINKLVLYVLLPALVFRTVMESRLDDLFLQIPLVAATGVLGCLALGFLVFHFLPIPGPTKGAMMLGAAFGNVTYLGLPVLLGVFPGQVEQVSEVSVLFEITKSSLNLTLGAMIAIGYGSQEPITLRNTLFEALKLPPIWALAVSIAWKASGIPCPALVLDTASILAVTVSGLMMLSLGMALRFKPTRLMALAVPVAIIKLAVSPLIVFAATGPVGLGGLYGTAAVLEGAMPSQLLSFIIAGKFKLDEETLAFVIMVDTILAFVTLSVVRSVLAG
ncbi:MAG: AEC family transporter [Proteobacteria bacterium]|nr:AEC family transporter [Pseudomonadota bacterium]